MISMFNLVAFRLQCFCVSVYKPAEHDSSVMLGEAQKWLHTGRLHTGMQD